MGSKGWQVGSEWWQVGSDGGKWVVRVASG